MPALLRYELSSQKIGVPLMETISVLMLSVAGGLLPAATRAGSL